MPVQRKARALVYALTDARSASCEYVVRFLDAMRDWADQIHIVSAGDLSPDLQERLRSHTDCLSRSPRIELAALYALGLSQLDITAYDEIILASDALFGPVRALDDMFSEMDGRAVDFWGLTRRTDGGNERLLPDFLVLRTEAARQVPSIAADSCLDLPHALAQAGLAWSAYADVPARDRFTEDVMGDYPMEVLDANACPLFSDACFNTSPNEAARMGDGHAALDLMDYLTAHKDAYDPDLVLEKLIKTRHQADLVKSLHFNYTLPIDAPGGAPVSEGLRVALFMHLYNQDMIGEMARYAAAMPQDADLFVTTGSEETKREIERAFAKIACRHFEARVIANRGRDVSAILVGVKDVVMDYDIACCVHDKKTGYLFPASIGETFARKCLENVLGSAAYVRGILNLFACHPRLGLLFPPEPMHAGYFNTLGNEWGPNFEQTQALSELLGLTAPLCIEKEPIAPMGSFFWFRPRAFAPLYAKDWQYDDFPPEPIGEDGSFLHAIERIRPYVVQSAGYYPAYVMNDHYSRIEYTNMKNALRGYNVAVLGAKVFGDQATMLGYVRSCLSLIQATLHLAPEKDLPEETRVIWAAITAAFSWKRRARIRLKRILPRSVYTLAVKAKRLALGPRGIPYRYDDE